MDDTLTDPDLIAATLRATLKREGATTPGSVWRKIAGGRTNLVWRIVASDLPDLICKLFVPGSGTRLFPNIPEAEISALNALLGTGLAPHLNGSWQTPFGPVIVYRACDGPTWREDADHVARRLRILHSRPPPPSLRNVSTSSRSILAEADALLSKIPDAAPLYELRPDAAIQPTGPQVFLHGDPVPGNIVMTERGAVFIDWQCPARGDPIHDIAMFLSPAMQVLDRGRALDREEREAFFVGYGDPEAKQRFEAAEPAFTWRMAVHCAWRISQGHRDYMPALSEELKRLDHFRQ